MTNTSSTNKSHKDKFGRLLARLRDKLTLQNIAASLRARTSGIRTTRWVRFGIVAALWLLFTIWEGSPWLILGFPILFDIYITGYVPLTWWKRSKSATTRRVMSWVDAIVYALVLVYFIFNFVGQNYSIPSSSMEKTLLTGDYLFVNKLTYGPRVPMTPVHFPLVHNTLPIINTKSYLESPSLKYHRLKGLRDVEVGDIVVFNFPAGDTVMTKAQNPDYYQLVRLYGYGSVNNNADVYGTKIYRPVDRRENYVKRVVGLPGNRLRVVAGEVYIDDVKQALPASAQFRYLFQTNGHNVTADEWQQLDVTIRPDMQTTEGGMLQVKRSEVPAIESLGFNVNYDAQGNVVSVPPIYFAVLTADNLAKLQAMPWLTKVMREPTDNDPLGIYPFALADREGWTRADYGGISGITIPAKGMTVELDYDNWLLYERPIRVYEGHTSARWDNALGRVVINGLPIDRYTFGMDYYFMMGDNRDNSLDSRYWGFVPEDHIVGTPWRVLISFDSDKSIFSGGIRWSRILKDANPDK